MITESKGTSENQIMELADNKVARKPLLLFKTDRDRYGTDISAMSDFFDGYIQQMSFALKTQSAVEIVSDLPMASLGIINDVMHQADFIMNGNTTYIADFDNLPNNIKSKLRNGLYKVGESKQVGGNLRAVILDENNVRVKDLTLKKVISDPGNIETARSIVNQLQLQQIYAKLTDIQEFQTYQLEKDRDRDIFVPFLDARSLVLEAENKDSEAERDQLYREADGKIRTALNAIYADVETTSKTLAGITDKLIKRFKIQRINKFMGYLTSDFQIAAKYIGIRLQLLEYLGDVKNVVSVLQQYQHILFDFLTKPVSRKGLPAVDLMQDYFPYDKTNLNYWHNFSMEWCPKLESNIRALKSSISGEFTNDVYIISVEDIKDGE